MTKRLFLLLGLLTTSFALADVKISDLILNSAPATINTADSFPYVNTTSTPLTQRFRISDIPGTPAFVTKFSLYAPLSSPTFTGTVTGTFSGNLTGNVTGNTSGSAGSFTGTLVGDVGGTQSATAIGAGKVTNAMLAGSIADSNLLTISTTGKVANSATTAASANTASAIVARDGSGNFSAGTISANLSGAVTVPAATASTFAYLDSGKSIVSQTPTQATALLNPFTSSLQGLAPSSGGGTSNFLRADGTWAAPPLNAGTVTSVSVSTANGVSGSVATATSTPAITLTLGAITPSSVAASGAVSGSNLSGTNTGDQTIALTGDVTGSGTGTFAASIGANKVTNAQLATMGAHTYKGNNTGSTANAADITPTQLTADLNAFTSSLQGLTPASGGGTINFLRADGSWTTPGGGGTVTSVGLSVPATSIFSATGSPVTATGTLGLTTTGTSGGVPYFSSTSALSSSAVLTANALVVGGGVGVAPAVLGSLGTTTTVLHGNASGAPTFGAASLTADVSGTLPIANGGTNSTATATAGGIGYGTGTAHAYSSAGTAGQMVISGGTGSPTFKTFTAPTVSRVTGSAHSGGFNLTGSGTYTTPANVLYIRVRMVGGGGGGAGSGTAASTGQNGGAGSSTTFGPNLTASAGNGGAGGGTSGASGNANTVSAGPIILVNQAGSQGGGANYQNITTVDTAGGAGGSSVFGGGGSSGYNQTGGAGLADTGSGGGGGGNGAALNSYSGPGGSSGGYIEAIITPTAGQTFSYSAAVAGNTGGSTGTGGNAGGAGAGGQIIVEEYYQ